VIDPSWSGPAIKRWIETQGNVRQSHDPHKVIGKGLSCETDKTGATWVKSIIIDTVAKQLIRLGALKAYSVFVMNAVIKPDPSGYAKNGIICGGEILELTVCDVPSNPSCGIKIAKSVNGTAQYVGKAFASDDPFGVVFKSAKAKPVVSPFDVFPGNKYTEKMFLREMASPNNPDPQSREAARMALGR